MAWSSECGEGHPPRHREYVRGRRCGLTRTLPTALILGAATLFLGWGYVHDRDSPLFALAPAAGLVFLLVLGSAFGYLDDIRHVAILPYFQKGHEMKSVGTFLSGHALARSCEFLDGIARREGLEPLSDFGFADDLAGEKVVWHDAARGLETVAGLLSALRRDPAPLPEAEAVADDLAPIEANLREAARLQIPFCLLLRHGSTASGHEMDVRQGFFCYGGPGE